MPLDNPPWQNVKLDAELAAGLRGMDIVMRDCEHAIRDIAAVGALLNLKGEMQPSDMSIIKSAVAALAKAGIPIHPEPRLQVYNLLAPVQSDFLWTGLAKKFKRAVNIAPRPKADFVVTCYVYGGSSFHASIDNLHPLQRDAGYEDFSKLYADYERFRLDRLTAVSRAQDEPGIWADSAYESGAKFVATYGGASDEIWTYHFNKAGRYRPVINTEEKFQRGGFGSSYGDFGFLVREDFRGEAAKLAKPENLLGQRLLAPV